MTPLALGQLLSLYTWFVLAALLLITLLIARFYQQFSGEKTHFRWLVLPILLFGVVVLRYNSIDQLGGDWFADSAGGIGGVIVILYCIRLYRQMTRHTRHRNNAPESEQHG
jgi:Ca2+/H+ antiporter